MLVADGRARGTGAGPWWGSWRAPCSSPPVRRGPPPPVRPRRPRRRRRPPVTPFRSWPGATRAAPPTSSTGIRTRKSTSCRCRRGPRASSSPPGTSTARCACSPTAASWAGSTPPCPVSTTSEVPSPTSNPPTVRSSTSPTARSAARSCTFPVPTRCRARASAVTRRRAPTACSTTTRPTRAAPSTRRATSSATTSPPPKGTTRRRAADAWWSGSPPTTRPIASSTARPRADTDPTTPTGRAAWSSRG